MKRMNVKIHLDTTKIPHGLGRGEEQPNDGVLLGTNDDDLDVDVVHHVIITRRRRRTWTWTWPRKRMDGWKRFLPMSALMVLLLSCCSCCSCCSMGWEGKILLLLLLPTTDASFVIGERRGQRPRYHDGRSTESKNCRWYKRRGEGGGGGGGGGGRRGRRHWWDYSKEEQQGLQPQLEPEKTTIKTSTTTTTITTTTTKERETKTETETETETEKESSSDVDGDNPDGEGPRMLLELEEVEERTSRLPLRIPTTATMTDLDDLDVIPPKETIIVLGGTGRIGRIVVNQLMTTPDLDAQIAVFVRDRERARRIYEQDGLISTKQTRTMDGSYPSLYPPSRGTSLTIIQTDLVPNQTLPNYVDLERESWMDRAGSAAEHYNTSMDEYDNGEMDVESVEYLTDCMKSATAVISCLGTIRTSKLFMDYLERPFIRLWNADVSRWCPDREHPYYVLYLTTRTALAIAEREQRRREAAHDARTEEERRQRDKFGFVLMPRHDFRMKRRIRFIRISDLCLSLKPWDITPLLTNTFRSMVFRYHDMADRLLEESTVLDTVVLRPGDLTDDDRDPETTNLQVCDSGELPYPAFISREDVATMAVTAALIDTTITTTNGTTDETNKNKKKKNNKMEMEMEVPLEGEEETTSDGDDQDDVSTQQQQQLPPSMHLALAMRWIEKVEIDGLTKKKRKKIYGDAKTCIEESFQKIQRKEQRKRRRRQQQQSLDDKNRHETSSRTEEGGGGEEEEEGWGLVVYRGRRPLKPYVAFVALGVYGFLSYLPHQARGSIMSALSAIPGSHRAYATTMHGLDRLGSLVVGTARVLPGYRRAVDFTSRCAGISCEYATALYMIARRRFDLDRIIPRPIRTVIIAFVLYIKNRIVDIAKFVVARRPTLAESFRRANNIPGTPSSPNANTFLRI